MDILSKGEKSYRAYRRGREKTAFAKIFQSVEEAGIPTKNQVAFAVYLSDRYLNGGIPTRIPGPYLYFIRKFYEEALKPENLMYIYKHTRPSTFKTWEEKVRQIRCQY